MYKVIVLILITILTLSFMMNADARRFGGGRSFGVARSNSNYSQSAQPASASRLMPPAAPSRSWLGPLAGFAVGGLLTSLFMGHGGGMGMGGGIFSWILLLGAGYVIWQLFRSRMQSASPSVSAPFETYAQPQNSPINTTYQQVNPSSYSSGNIGMDKDEFLRIAKGAFIRLQAAYDAKNLSDLREFTTPEVYAEIQLQLQERGVAENITEVVSLNAELLNTEAMMQNLLASVQFTGLIKEAANQPAEQFVEIWHFRKDADQSTWKVAGLQQEEKV